LQKQPPLANHGTGVAEERLFDAEERCLFGVTVHAVTQERALEICADAVRGDDLLRIGVLNAAKVVKLRRRPDLREALLACDLMLADGMAVVWASRLLGRPLPERVAGIDLFTNLLEAAGERGESVYILGAKQEVLDRVLEVIHESYPRLRVAGARDGYFSNEDEPAIAEAIREAGADYLFLGMTTPKKEQFIERWGTMMGVKVCHGVGGSLDVMAGKVKRAPDRWQKLGLEWLYRVCQEPRRLWKRYLVTNTLFLGLVIRELVAKSPPYLTRERDDAGDPPGAKPGTQLIEH
jgi:N-acetylglucosaminyldiphosphoundecaprenol N-acetyl-beta-D-mannosaminyltransferase